MSFSASVVKTSSSGLGMRLKPAWSQEALMTWTWSARSDEVAAKVNWTS